MSKLKFNEVHQDLINSWLLGLHQAIENSLDLTVEEQEHLEAVIYGNISEHLEQFFNYPGYNNYN